MNDESIDLENYFAPGKLVNLTTRHDDKITGNVGSKFGLKIEKKKKNFGFLIIF